MAEIVEKSKKKSRLANHFSKSWSELKKVSWPTLNTVVKNTAVVLVVILFFLVVIGATDVLLGWLLKLIRS
jgi:preprotein translocase SecE subunit